MRFYGFTLDSSPVIETITTRVRWPEVADSEWTDETREQFEAWRTSWLFWGSYGTGKTGLAIGLAREFFRLGDGVPSLLFVSMPDFLSALRDTYNVSGASEMAVIERYREPELLILDDLGAEHVKDSGWLEDRLYQLIGHRHADMRSTLFTSNLSPAQLGARIGERNMWRIVEMCGPDHIIEVKGPNLRA